MTEPDWLRCDDPQPMLDFLYGKVSERKLLLFTCACCQRAWHLLGDARSRQAVTAAGLRADDLRDLQEIEAVWNGAEDALRHICDSRRGLSLGYFAEELAADAAMRVAEAMARAGSDAFDAHHHAASAARLAGEAVAYAAAKDAALFIDPTDDILAETEWFDHLDLPAGPVDADSYYRVNVSTRILVRGRDVEVIRSAWTAEARARCALLREVFGNPVRPAGLDPAWLGTNVLPVAQSIYEESGFDRLPILADALMDAGCTDEQVLGHCRSAGPHVRGCWVVDLLLGKS